MRWWAWIRSRDPGGLAFARAVRVTIVAPTLFAVALEVFHEPAIATTAAFGAISALVFSDFGGRTSERIRAYLVLGVLGAALLAAGTLASGSTPWSVALTFVVAAMVRFSGNLGPRWAAAVSPLILAVVLGALVPAPASAIPDRMLGWGMALVVAAVASATILPRRSSVQVTGIAAGAATEIAAVLRVAVAHPDADARTRARARLAKVQTMLRVASLMPARPAGPGAAEMARRQIIDGLTRFSRLLDLALQTPAVALSDEMRAVGDGGARCLEASARVLRGEAPATELAAALATRDAVRADAFDRVGRAVQSGEDAETVLARVDAGFVARAGAWYAAIVGRNVGFLTGAPDQPVTAEPVRDVPEESLHAASERFEEFVDVHVRPSSVWFRDAARAGVALAAAVFVARELGVDHAFWVALGTLSVLRSSALATGQTALAGAIGTAVGFGVSSGVLAVVGLDRTALWIVLVVGVFGLALLPQVAGFGAGQAAFTVAVVALFNLVEPRGWHTGLTRVQDVAIGVSVSAVVALVFWPRRLEPLVGRLVEQLSAAAAGGLERVVQHGSDAAWIAGRRNIAIVEARVRAAIVELLVQERLHPEVVESSIARLGVAAHARSAGDAIARLPAVLPDAAPDDARLSTALSEAVQDLAPQLAAGRGAPEASAADAVAQRTRAAAVAAIAHGSAAPLPVVRSLLTRDWLIAVAQMVDARP